MERIQCYPQGAEFLANLLIHRHRSTPHYASSFIISPTNSLDIRRSSLHVLCLLVNDFQGQWKKGVLGVQLQNLLADTDTQLLTFNGSPAAQILHGFYKSKISLIFYLTWFSLEKNLNFWHSGQTKISFKI